MSEWKETTLGDLVTFQRGHDLPQTKFKGGKYPIIGSNGIIGYHDEYTTDGEGITIGRSGNIGTPFFIEEKFWAHNTTLYVKKFHGSYPKFVFYLLKTINFLSLNSGSAVPSLNRNYIHPFPVTVPAYNEQKRIAAVLSCLDDKIENLRKQNETLEKIAQTLFKHWFIDFEFPNENGQPYRSSGGAMQPSELGAIPAGWRVGDFSDFFELLSGGTPKTSISEYWNGNINWLSAKDVTQNHSSFILKTEKTITELGIKKSAAKLLPKYTTIVSARGTVGNYCMLSKSMAISQSNFGVISHDRTKVFYGFLLISNLIKTLKKSAYGSVFDTVTARNFQELKIVIPCETKAKIFEDIVQNIYNKILLQFQQIQTLTKTRDTLLPELMSGKLRVPE